MSICRIILIIHTALMLVLPAVMASPPSSMPTSAPRWQVIDSLITSGLTTSAQDSVERMYARAKKDGNADQTIKAIMYRMKLASFKEEDAFVKAIEQLNAEVKESKSPVTQVLHSMLAQCYWHYYQNNRYRFIERTQTIGLEMKDIRTWDLATIMKATADEYLLSLVDADALKKTKLGAYDEVIGEQSSGGAKLRPTLYDFLAHRALEFFMTDDGDLPRPSFEFTLNNEDYFKPFEAFSRLKITTPDTASLKYRAIKLLQEVISFHAGDAVPEALIDADLKRLQFVREHAVLSDKDSLYLKALQALEKQFSASSTSAEVTFAIASLYRQWAQTFQPRQDGRYRWMNKRALELCEKAQTLFPKSYGAQQCAALAGEIKAKNMGFTVEEVNVPGKVFKALVKCRNVKRVYWREVKIDREEYRLLMEHGDSVVIKLAKYKPVKEWSIDFPDAGDFQSHSVEAEMPALPAGHYVVMAGSDPEFKYKGQAIAFASTQVSGICFINRMKTGGGQEFHVLDRETGSPIKRVTVKSWRAVYDEKTRDYRRVLHGTYGTDEQGNVSVEPTGTNYENCTMEFINGNDRLMSGGEYSLYRYGKPEKPISLRTFFFTDRAIYRPGQTVHFKGVMLRTNGETSEVAAGVSTTVRFYNVNNQEVAHLDLAANKYGSVQGTFTTPSNTLNGQMRIGDEHGNAWFAVEKYKRPKFGVVMNPYKGTAGVGEKIRMEGVAKAYAGSAIDGAKVKYRVIRSARFPDWWWCGWRPSQWSSEMEITSGYGVTNDTGGFVVEFKAIADASIPRNEQPIFNYQIFADVTDVTGETRSTIGSVSVGYESMTLKVDIAKEVNKNTDTAFRITTENMNGTFVSAQGKIVVWNLKPEELLVRRRLWEQPDTALMTKMQHDASFPTDPFANETDITKWPRGKRIYESDFDTQKEKTLRLPGIGSWDQGAYVLEAVTRDASGHELKGVSFFTLFSDTQKTLPSPLPDWFVPIKTTCEPGEKAVFLIGTSYENTSVLYEVEHKGEIIAKEWITLNKNQRRIELPVEEKHRGNLAVHFTFVRDNRSYQHDAVITVPWTNKELTISFETFRSKLVPGEKESWKIKIAGPKKDKVAAEMVAALYDASLDAFRPHNWDFSIYPSYGVNRSWSALAGFGLDQARVNEDEWNVHPSSPSRNYPNLNWFGHEFQGGNFYDRMGRRGVAGIGYGEGYGSGYNDETENKTHGAGQPRHLKTLPMSKSAVASADIIGKGGFAENIDAVLADVGGMKAGDTHEAAQRGSQQEVPTPDLSKIPPRTNLSETAFFFPLLQTNDSGEVIINFTIPEALTKWKMLGFAHTQDLKFGQITNELITQKDLMVIPNPPRFFRENDTIMFTAKVSNFATADLSGTARLMLVDAATNKPVDAIFMNKTPQIPFTAKKGQSAPLSWFLTIPEGIGAVTIKVVANAGTFTDGEEQIIPVLSNRMLVTETMPLPIRRKETKTFTFNKLVTNNNGSTTLRNHKLTLEFTSNPAWYAIQALPYLMEYPYECAEQIFARFYANTIASSIANSSPRIKAVFDAWRTTSPDALLSNLEKNKELKSLVLEETPWLLDGKDESERKKRVGLLFDLNKMGNERDRALAKLEKQQLSNGGWPWFEGMPDDRYITQYITIGMGRLARLGMIDLRTDARVHEMVRRSLRYLDDRIREDYAALVNSKGSLDSCHLGETQIQYLYARSFYHDQKVDGSARKALDYYTGQAKKHWLRNSRYMQGMIALTLDRRGDKVIPAKIIRSLRENAITNEEMGMYWNEMYEQQGYWWYRAPIETQALMIEAFDEVARDTVAVEALKTWLLKGKQTQNWSTTKATAEACYALLLRGTTWLDAPSTVNIALGDVFIDAAKPTDASVEAGTGYFKTSWSGPQIKPSMGNITITKKEPGVAWGAVYWQYFEQIDKITPAQTPLKINKKLFLQQNFPTGLKITPIIDNTALKPGDKVTVRIELRVDRDMEYVHMKDMRASGFEPVNVFSGYRWQDGLGYYESTRDAATNFFFGFLRKGTHVFEYPLVVSHAGDFSCGITSVQCMYAPEFAGHSEGIRVKVRKE